MCEVQRRGLDTLGELGRVAPGAPSPVRVFQLQVGAGPRSEAKTMPRGGAEMHGAASKVVRTVGAAQVCEFQKMRAQTQKLASVLCPRPGFGVGRALRTPGVGGGRLLCSGHERNDGQPKSHPEVGRDERLHG